MSRHRLDELELMTGRHRRRLSQQRDAEPAVRRSVRVFRQQRFRSRLAGDFVNTVAAETASLKQRASGVGARVWSDRVPALPGAAELAAQGVESTLAPENRRALPGGGMGGRSALLVDPQTSGGLLAGIAQERAAMCVAALRATGIAAAIVGVVEIGEPEIRLGSD